MMDKPDVDSIEGLSPAIAIEQKATSHNPRSTVGTVTEIYDYLRLLFARAGIPRCPDHRIDLTAQTVSQMVDQVLRLPEGTAAALLAPLVSDRKGEHAEVLEDLAAQGFVRVRIDGRIHEMDALPKLDPKRKHTIEAVVDRMRIRAGRRPASRRVVRDRAAPVGRPGAARRSSTSRQREELGVLQPPRLPGLRLQRAAARAEAVLVQQPGRRVPGLRRPGREAILRSRSAWSCIRICRSPAARSAAGTGATPLLPAHSVARAALRVRHRDALERAAGGACRRSLLNGSGDEVSSSATAKARDACRASGIPSKASCPTSSGAIARPNPSRCARSSRSILACARAPIARARG